MSSARFSPAIRRCGLVLVAIALAAPAAHAQVRDPILITAAAANSRADTLEARLETLLGTPDTWREAAKLQRRAAELRGDDPRATKSWSRAGWFYAGTRDYGLARQMHERAAQHAMAGGDVERAAQCLIDAALVALEDQRTDLVPRFVQRTRRLADSPLLTAAQRSTIIERVEGAPRLAQHWTP